MKAASQQDYLLEYDFVNKFYGADFSYVLKAQLESFGVCVKMSPLQRLPISLPI